MNDYILSTKVNSAEMSDADVEAYNRNYGAFREGISKHQVVEYYNGWAKIGYEKDLDSDRYLGPCHAADTIAKYFNDKEAKIIDVGAGTGLVGEHLQKLRFTNVDGLDPAKSMLEVAKKKNIYRNYICDYLGGTAVQISDDHYDGLVISGGMGEGHIPCKGLTDMIRIVKPGGIIVIVMRQEYLDFVQEYKDRLEPMMQELVKAGQWRSLKRNIIPKFFCSKNGIVFVFEVLAKGFNVPKSSVIHQY